ncbi:uncharacterized protein [Paramormyrops kingsleyae]|uniref:uncharacterized protein n=1 Tax=Paramormyrops kingsleyae TaxID=1676925 RepID=UPI003B96C028
MRLSAIPIVLCFCFLALLAYYAVRQEMVLQRVRNHVQVVTEEVQKAERKRVQCKEKIQELSGPLSSAADKTNDLTKAKTDVLKAEREFLNNLQACNTHKAEITKSKNASDENLKKLKADQEKEKKAAEQQTRRLKEKISERDKKLCQFVDLKNGEGRKLCGNAQAPK